MIKIEKFWPNREKMEASFNKKVSDMLGDPFSDPFHSYPGSYRKVPSFDYAELSTVSQKDSKVQETWINPDFIVKIDVLKNKMSEETYLKITMKNGDTYDVVGDSVQSFFLKNAILGNDVSA